MGSEGFDDENPSIRLVVLSAWRLRWRFVLVGWLVIGKEDKNTHILRLRYSIDQWIDILVIDICFKDWFLPKVWREHL